MRRYNRGAATRRGGADSGGAAWAPCHSVLNALSVRCLFHMHVEMSQAVGNMSLEFSREIQDRDLEVVWVIDII